MAFMRGFAEFLGWCLLAPMLLALVEAIVGHCLYLAFRRSSELTRWGPIGFCTLRVGGACELVLVDGSRWAHVYGRWYVRTKSITR